MVMDVPQTVTHPVDIRLGTNSHREGWWLRLRDRDNYRHGLRAPTTINTATAPLPFTYLYLPRSHGTRRTRDRNRSRGYTSHLRITVTVYVAAIGETRYAVIAVSPVLRERCHHSLLIPCCHPHTDIIHSIDR